MTVTVTDGEFEVSLTVDCYQPDVLDDLCRRARELLAIMRVDAANADE